MKYVSLLVLPIACALGAATAQAQTKEVTIAHQDMIVPFRVQQAAGAVEKATGYKINWKMFGGGGDVIKAMASGEVLVEKPIAPARRPSSVSIVISRSSRGTAVIHVRRPMAAGSTSPSQ